MSIPKYRIGYKVTINKSTYKVTGIDSETPNQFSYFLKAKDCIGTWYREEELDGFEPKIHKIKFSIAQEVISIDGKALTVKKIKITKEEGVTYYLHGVRLSTWLPQRQLFKDKKQYMQHFEDVLNRRKALDSN